MKDQRLKRRFRPIDVIREAFPDISDEDASYLLWTHTGWPSFWKTDDPEEEIRQCMFHLKSVFDRGRIPCELCSKALRKRTRTGVCFTCRKTLCGGWIQFIFHESKYLLKKLFRFVTRR